MILFLCKLHYFHIKSPSFVHKKQAVCKHIPNTGKTPSPLPRAKTEHILHIHLLPFNYSEIVKNTKTFTAYKETNFFTCLRKKTKEIFSLNSLKFSVVIYIFEKPFPSRFLKQYKHLCATKIL